MLIYPLTYCIVIKNGLDHRLKYYVQIIVRPYVNKNILVKMRNVSRSSKLLSSSKEQHELYCGEKISFLLSFDIVNVQGRLIFVFSRINKLQSNVDGLWTSQKEGYNDKNIYYHYYDLALIHFDMKREIIVSIGRNNLSKN